MEPASEDCVTTVSERLETTATVSMPLSLWHGAVSTFRHAQLQRLEARVTRLQRRLQVAPPGHEQGVIIMAAEPQAHADTGLTSAATPSRRARSWTGVLCTLMLAGVVLHVLVVRNHDSTAAAFLPTPAASQVIPTAQEVTELRTLLTSLNERVTMLHHQVLQQGDQLTTQSATVLRVNQHADTQQTQVTALADALAVLTTHVVHLEQQVTTQATRLAAHEQQRATQTTQREPLVPPPQHMRRVTAKTAGRSRRPRPPTLELLAPPSALAPISAPSLSAPLPAAGALSQRRSITLPAALGAEGYRAPTGTTGGTSP